MFSDTIISDLAWLVNDFERDGILFGSKRLIRKRGINNSSIEVDIIVVINFAVCKLAVNVLLMDKSLYRLTDLSFLESFEFDILMRIISGLLI